MTFRVTEGAIQLSRPIQFWRPHLQATLGRPANARDAQRAFQAWNGERTIWLLPGLKQPVTWREDPDNARTAVLAIPAEHIERVDVTHIGTNGYMVGGGSIDGLLETFLDTREFQQFVGPGSIELEVPHIDGNKVTYVPITIPCQPGSTMPVASVEGCGDHLRVSATWPPGGRPCPPVSVDAESDEFYGRLQRGEFEGLPVAMRAGDPNPLGIYSVFSWSDRIDPLFPVGGGGADALFHQALMCEVAESPTSQAREALRQAREHALPYLSHAEAIRAEAYFAPLVEQVGADRAVVMTDFGMSTPPRDFAGACRSRVWKKKMLETVEVTRVWGPIGLFWALLIDGIDRGRRVRPCERCGHFIAGTRGKRYCNRSDNEDCYRARRAGDQRKCRASELTS